MIIGLHELRNLDRKAGAHAAARVVDIAVAVEAAVIVDDPHVVGVAVARGTSPIATIVEIRGTVVVICSSCSRPVSRFATSSCCQVC